MTKTEYIVMTRAACMPGHCWGKYGRVAVVEVDPAQLRPGDYEPRMISDRARGVVEIVKTWERRNIGTTDQCAFNRVVAEAEELAERLATALIRYERERSAS